MSAVTLTSEDLRAAYDDVQVFSRMVGYPLTDWQAEPLRLESLFTVVIGARQVGKSRALAVLAVWWSFRRPGQQVLIVSAGEDGARRVLREVRAVLAGHPLLSSAVVDEQAGLVLLDNGSRITAVAQSERAIRGERVDLLLVDESSTVTDDVFEGAALPTITARAGQGAKVVLAGTPWGISGWFYRYAMLGEQGSDPDVRTFRWRVDQCPWVTPALVERMRQTMSPARFRSEYECQFTDSGTGLFSRSELMEAVAPYRMLHPLEQPGGNVVLGLDWGGRNDWHGVVALGVLDDGGANGWPVVYPAWVEASQRTYDEQVGLVKALANHRAMVARRTGAASGRAWLAGPTRGRTVHPDAAEGLNVVRLFSEANGVGQWPTEHLETHLPGRVQRVNTTQASKELAFGRIQGLLSQGRLLLPDHDRLLRELTALEVTTTEHGGLRIAAPDRDRGHDDLALAFSFAALALTDDVTVGRVRERRDLDTPGLVTTSGLWCPQVPSPREGGMGYGRDFAWVE